jgi:type I restriction enzyme S subunit
MSSSREGWTRVRFGDVVRLVRDRVDPETSGISRYVAGEHMDTDDLRIHRWGEVGDGYLGPAFHMRFKPGHVLYGSRRTYLRKVAVADFEGICANTTFVLESADPSVLVPDLLPFVMQAEGFHEHSIKQSKGSVNPYVNFSDLAWYAFDLPPVEEQRTACVALRASVAAIDTYTTLSNAGAGLTASLLAGFATSAASTVPLQAACSSAITYGIVQAGPHVEDGVPYIRVSDMTKGDLTPEGMLRTSHELAARFTRSRVEAGNIVVALRGVAGLPAIVPTSLHGANLTQGTAKVALLPDYDTRFVYWMLQSPSVKKAVGAAAKGSTFKEITLESLREIPLPVFPMDKQREIASTMDAHDAAIRAASFRAAQCRDLSARMIRTVTEQV